MTALEERVHEIHVPQTGAHPFTNHQSVSPSCRCAGWGAWEPNLGSAQDPKRKAHGCRQQIMKKSLNMKNN
jgi:hypothetical protein